MHFELNLWINVWNLLKSVCFVGENHSLVFMWLSLIIFFIFCWLLMNDVLMKIFLSIILFSKHFKCIFDNFRCHRTLYWSSFLTLFYDIITCVMKFLWETEFLECKLGWTTEFIVSKRVVLYLCIYLSFSI